MSLLAASSTSPTSSPLRTVPSAMVLSPISIRRCLGTRGWGFLYLKLYMSLLLALCISRTSLCPQVVRRPTLAPLLSIIVFMATVWPWIICPISSGETPLCFTQSITPFESSLGVLSTFTHLISWSEPS